MSEYKFKINGKDYSVNINSIEGNLADVTVNGKNYSVEMENAPVVAPQAAPATVPAASQTAPAATVKAAGAGTTIPSPLPGVIIDVCVKEGQAVKSGQKLAVLEAMKMENDILATVAGTVSAIHVSKGDSILEGANIVTIA